MWAKLNFISRQTKYKAQYLRSKTSEFTIGRHPDCEMQVLDGRLSGSHCRITRSQGDDGKMKVTITDLSTNGTYLNGNLVS